MTTKPATAAARTSAATNHSQRPGAAGGSADTHEWQTARRLVKRMTISTQSAQQGAPQSAHTPAAGA